MIFQALGAKYTFGMVVRHLFAYGAEKDAEVLQKKLSEKYKGEVVLYRKGRAALAESIRIATGGKGAVAISALTCYSVIQAVEAAGCTPVYIDIQEEDLNFSSATLQEAVEKNPDIKAVVVQNMLGLPADIASIQKVTSNKEIVLIEDLAHSAGATYKDGREVGTIGDITMLSFGRDKAIDVVNGGALIVRSNSLAEPRLPSESSRFVDQLRDRIYPLISWKTRILYPIKGIYIMAIAIKLKLVVRSADGAVKVNERLPYWQAKLALLQVEQLSHITKRRQDNARLYIQNLKSELIPALSNEGVAPIRVPLVVKNRKDIISHLKNNGVQVNDIWYDVPVSPERFYNKVNYPEADNPTAVRVAGSLINLPTHERMTAEQIIKITHLVNEVVE